ncbi:MAG: polysaccharide biosynthesis/export family protein [Phycisphaeraceae bacterium]|nr:polysaccharide biosynthesis/export family protein [Phycisphaeraceae bacterium]MCW5768102.1 polysaccharide biosynthesis/export family protein [Phycisphaeraceae bacterium]
MSRLRGRESDSSRAHSYLLRCVIAAAGGVVLLGGMSGCETDSFIDPSVVGRWEHTPTTVPILERIAAIEDPRTELVEYTEPTGDDLRVDADDYRIGPGDALDLVIFDMIVPRQPDGYQRIVDSRGNIDLPQLGSISVNGMTADEVVRAIQERMRPFVGNPLATVNVANPRQMTFNVIGAVRNPAPYFMPSRDYRVLEALTAAGGFPETTPYVYVIRQVPLSASASAGARAGSSNAPERTSVPTFQSGEDLLRVIDDLAGGADSPSVGASAPARVPSGGLDEPPIDLVDQRSTPSGAGAPTATPVTTGTGGNWVYLNDRWVQVQALQPEGGLQGESGPRLVTQRVIRVPVKPLLAGDARYNIVIRPGDILRVPSPDTGIVYAAGQVARPGVYQLPDAGRLTLTRLIDAAGGLGALAIPDRVDLTRMVGQDRQATIRLNLRAIAEGTQPDVFLRADDRVNVGTNFWAFPLAVARGGFRVTYGFGFLLDRNFGNDVFGPPPTSGNRGF